MTMFQKDMNNDATGRYTPPRVLAPVEVIPGCVLLQASDLETSASINSSGQEVEGYTVNGDGSNGDNYFAEDVWGDFHW